MKALLIGQLPKEVGGNYTTGIAKVVYELSLQKVEGLEYSVYATNAKQGRIVVDNSPAHYYGYKFLIGKMICNMLFHPIRTLKEWKVYKEKGHVNPLRYEFYKANFQNVLKIVKPDLIHMNGTGIEPLYFANQNRIPVVLTCHGVFHRTKNPDSSAKLYADYVTGLTDETKEEILNYLCVEEGKISIIPNGVDTAKFYYSEAEREKIRKEMGVKESTKVFITVASVQERKGQLRFTQILKDYDGGDWEYWIVGKGPDELAIKDYCELNGIDNKVKLLGYKNGAELYKYYSAADIYAHASTMEGQALCEIEAFSTGLRVLVNNLIKGTIAKKELEMGDYLFVNFNSPDYETIKQWINKPNLERKSNKNLDWSKVAIDYNSLYQTILGCDKVL